MPNKVRNLGICFLVSLTLLIHCSSAISNGSNAFAEVNENTLESIVNQTGKSEGIAQINTGRMPVYIDNYIGGFVYVINSDSEDVTVIDPNTNTVVKNIPVGSDPTYMEIDYWDDKNNIYVSNFLSDSISVIDPNTNTVVNNITVGDSPDYIYSNKHGIYVSHFLSNTVSAIDPSTIDPSGKTVVENITVGDSPQFMDGDKSSDALYVSNSGSNFISVINTSSNTVMENITVGGSPGYIDEDSGAIYVTLPYDNIVSVINHSADTVKNITVGQDPSYILGLDSGIYVSNYGSNSVSVIDPSTIDPSGKTVVKTIPVGDSPNYMFGNSASNSIYVVNDFSNIISVIDPNTNTVVKNITVGEFSSGEESRYMQIGRYPDIYVANDDGISVINGRTNEVVAGVTFDVNPFRGGEIVCNSSDNDDKDLDAPMNRYIYVSSGSGCIAKPSKGFEFSSWVEVLDGNSTRTINATSGSPWWAGLLDTFDLKPNDPAATLTVNRFGNFTAYFRVLPPTIPSEYLVPLYGIIISTVVGLSIPSIITWRKSKKQTSRLNSYHQEMTSLYDDCKLDESDTEHLNSIKKNIINAYSEGKINNEQYTNLKEEISALYEEIYRKRLDALKDSSNEDVNRTVVIEKIQEDIKDAYSKGKISELHYNLLNERTKKITSENDTTK